MESMAEGGEKGCPPRFRPGGGSGDRGVRDNKHFNPVGVSLEPFLKDRHRAGGRRRGRDEGGETREDTLPVSLDPVWRRVRRSEPCGREGDYYRDVI